MENILFMHPRFFYIHASAHSSSLLLLGLPGRCVASITLQTEALHSDGARPKRPVDLFDWVGG